MQTSAEFDSIKRGVTALSSLTYCQPSGVTGTTVGIPSILGKRSGDNSVSRFGPLSFPQTDHGPPHTSKLLQYVTGISQTNPISNAWMIHQGNFAEENGSDSEDDDEEPSNVPLHVAVGYGEESYPFYHDGAAGVSHPFPGFPLASHSAMNPAMLGTSDPGHMSMWPFSGDGHHAIGLHDYRLAGHLGSSAHHSSAHNHDGNQTGSSSRPKGGLSEFGSSSARIVPRMQPISDPIQRDTSRFTSVGGAAAQGSSNADFQNKHS